MTSNFPPEQVCYSRPPPFESYTPNQGSVDPLPKGTYASASISTCPSLDLGSVNVQEARKRQFEPLAMAGVVDRQVDDKENFFMQKNGAAAKKRRLPTSVDDVVLMAKALLPSAEHESVSAAIRDEGIDGEF